jgi:hypothetical protein
MLSVANSVQLEQQYLTKEALGGFGDFKIGGQVIRTVKYADDLVLPTKEEGVLHSMINRLIEIGRCFGMETNEEKTKVRRVSLQPSQIQSTTDRKQQENVEYFNYKQCKMYMQN